ncbi:MAG: DUF4180 domain-containing protein [Chlorobiaceae bacterium]|nr:DUF4180 domain-containing protein [Chlorobiaceae bacterium]NTV59709.1 DUF4180 domain-containing protein [Chlorobiaceae bacterium]
MGIQYTTKTVGGILYVEASGYDHCLADVEEYVIGLHKVCLESGVQLVLCDESAVKNDLSCLDTYEVGLFLSRFVPTYLRIAIVFNPDTSFDIRFLESMLINRGQQIRIFTDTASAREWLESL